MFVFFVKISKKEKCGLTKVLDWLTNTFGFLEAPISNRLRTRIEYYYFFSFIPKLLPYIVSKSMRKLLEIYQKWK